MLVEEAFLFLTGQMKKLQRGIMTKGGRLVGRRKSWIKVGRLNEEASCGRCGRLFTPPPTSPPPPPPPPSPPPSPAFHLYPRPSYLGQQQPPTAMESHYCLQMFVSLELEDFEEERELWCIFRRTCTSNRFLLNWATYLQIYPLLCFFMSNIDWVLLGW